MKKITIYHHSECSKSNEVLQILEEACALEPFELEVIEYVDDPPTEEQLDRLLRMLKLEPKDLVRRSEEEYQMLKLGLQPPKSREAWLKIFYQYPILIERPIVTDGRTAIIGRPPAKVKEWLSGVR